MLLPALLCLFAQVPLPLPETPLSGLIRAELAFAELAARQSTRAAFLANLHPQSVVFHPGPVDGRKTWLAKSEDPGLLSWYPIFAELSEDGSLGYTSGPAEYRKERSQAQPTWKGRFLSVWRKSPEGRWSLVFDAGDDQPCSGPALTPGSTPRPAMPQGVDADQEASFLERDRARLSSLGDLAYVIDSPQGLGPRGKASMRIWKKSEGKWRLRAMVESGAP